MNLSQSKDYINKLKSLTKDGKNLIHASDSPDSCEDELKILLNENITNFKSCPSFGGVIAVDDENGTVL